MSTPEKHHHNKNYHHIDMSGKDGKGHSFHACEFYMVDFTKADLRDVSFFACDFTRCRFIETDLRKARFLNCVVSDCNFDGAKTEGINFGGTTTKVPFSLEGVPAPVKQTYELPRTLDFPFIRWLLGE